VPRSTATARRCRGEEGQFDAHIPPVLSERGVTLVEFALVGPIFIFLLLAIIEIGLTMLTQFVLETGRCAARRGWSGQGELAQGVHALATVPAQRMGAVFALSPSRISLRR
jgi:hypothetical protein